MEIETAEMEECLYAQMAGMSSFPQMFIVIVMYI